jgi:predicted CXXCH cytochrome family protein
LKRISTILLIGCVFFIGACSSSTSHGVLSFFFDGVPDSTGQKIAAMKAETDSTSSKKQKTNLVQSESQFVSHGPYKAKLCYSCHSKEGGFALIKSTPELCYDCHTQFEEKQNFVHGAVAAGYCNKCHHPHRSKNKFILTKTGKDLCFQCHDINDIDRIRKHIDATDLDCLVCHDPHSGENKYFLKTDSL